MRIGVDARYLSAKPSGIGRLSRMLLEEMFVQAPEIDWVVLVHESFPFGWPSQPPPHLELHRTAHAPVSLHTLTKLGAWIRSRRVDLWHAQFPLAPPIGRTPLVVTVNDLQPLLCPGWTGGRPWPLPWLYREFYKKAYSSAVLRAGAMVCISSWTARTVVEQWPAARGRVSTIRPGIEDFWRSCFRESDQSDKAPPTVLFVGSTRPNKNLPLLIDSFATMLSNSLVPKGLRLRLILDKDRHWPAIEDQIKKEGLKEQVSVTECLSDEDLAREYRSATVLAHLATHEGFGFPPLEAMACGCPVVCADHGALPETCEGATLLVDKLTPDGVSASLTRVLTTPTLREELIAKGKRRVRELSATDAARAMLSVFWNILK